MKKGIPRIKPVSQPIIAVCIVPGKASEYQKKLFGAFFTRLIATVQNELKTENEAKGEH